LVLIDSYRSGQFGGTGETGNWTAIRSWIIANPEIPVVLAGGLTPDNVAAAIAAVRPAAVDTASGVEIASGVKDPAAMAAFVAAARQAWKTLPPCQPA
jgi:phosphoribosylanthranilate isomerase